MIPLNRDPHTPRNAVEIAVERANPVEAVNEDNRRMDCIPGGQSPIPRQYPPRFVHHVCCDGEDIRKNRPRQFINSLGVRPPLKRPITVKDLLKRFRIDCRLELAIGDTIQKRQLRIPPSFPRVCPPEAASRSAPQRPPAAPRHCARSTGPGRRRGPVPRRWTCAALPGRRVGRTGREGTGWSSF